MQTFTKIQARSEIFAKDQPTLPEDELSNIHLSDSMRVIDEEDRVNLKRRQVNEPNPEEVPKRARLSQDSGHILASGILANGEWVDNMKFGCIMCRRGHRAKQCKCVEQGNPLGPVPKAGRPSKGTIKTPKCICPRRLPCGCRHQSYILRRTSDGRKAAWEIHQAVVTTGRNEIVFRGTMQEYFSSQIYLPPSSHAAPPMQYEPSTISL